MLYLHLDAGVDPNPASEKQQYPWTVELVENLKMSAARLFDSVLQLITNMGKAASSRSGGPRKMASRED